MMRFGLLFFVLLIFVCVINCGNAEAGDDIQLKIPQGKLVGQWKKSYGGKLYGSFQGIPFARPPVGSRRFKEPEKAKHWHGVWNAKRLSSECIQYHQKYVDDSPDNINGDEDCLYLNVYSANPKSSANLPVIVYIHGGAFVFGSGVQYRPDFLLDRDVILVTLNYRLGPFGFLSTQDDVVPGNNGLKDQTAALQWVKENIKYFGGNPNSVTITGMSAGGASVNYHMLSPLSKGLFHRGISQSGTAFCAWALQENALQKAMKIGDHLGCPTSSTKELIECLVHRPAEAIVATTSLLMPWIHSPFSPYAPVIEPADTKNAFITQHPYTIIKSGRALDVPWIASTTTQEGLYPSSIFIEKGSYLDELEEQWDKIVQNVFDFNYTLPSSMHAEAAKKIKHFYMNDEPISMKTFPQLIKALGDRLFIVDIEKTIKMQSTIGKKPIYYYVFAYRGLGSLGKFLSDSEVCYGVSHGDDTGYVLNTTYMNPTKAPNDRKMINFMVEMFVSFATDGVPSIGNTLWKPVKVENDEMNYLEILGPDQISMKKTADLSESDGFWSTLGIKENDALSCTSSKDEL